MPTATLSSKIAALVKRRHVLGLSQRELDALIGVSDCMIAKWETGKRNPTASSLERWAAALGMRLDLAMAAPVKKKEIFLTILALDPGLKGGVAVLRSATDWQTWPMPLRRFRYGTDRRRRAKELVHVDIISLHWMATMSHASAIVVEQQTSMPRQSAISTGTSFTNYGLLLALRLLAPLHIVHPATWKAKLKVPSDKLKATKRCAELLGPGTPSRDGPAEALMLAYYWHVHGGKDDGSDQSELRNAGAIGKAKAVRGGFPAGATDSRGAAG